MLAEQAQMVYVAGLLDDGQTLIDFLMRNIYCKIS